MYYTLLTSYFMMKNMKSKGSLASKKLHFGRSSPNVLCNVNTTFQNNNSKVCRVCLKEGSLPIFGHNSNISKAVSTFGDILIKKDDEFPKYLCTDCLNLLKSALIFRRTAKQSNKILNEHKINSLNSSKLSNSLVKNENLKKPMFVNVPCKDGKELSRKKQKFKSSSKLKLQKPHGHTYKKKHNESDQLSSVGFASDQDYLDDTDTQPSAISQHYSPVVTDNEFEEDSVKNHPVKKKQKVRCKVCSLIMAKGQFKNHYDIHYPLKKYMCDVCGKSFRQNCSLRRHYTTHSTEFPYKCTNCPYRASNCELLKSHLRIHRGDFKYLCTECPKRFRFRSNLNKHVVKHKEPAFSCDFCKKSYYFKNYLERHIQGEHLGQKEHVCHICAASFSFRKGLRKHMVDLHKYEKFKFGGRIPAYMMAEMKKRQEQGKDLIPASLII